MSQILTLSNVRVRADIWRFFVVMHITPAVLFRRFHGDLFVFLSKIETLPYLDEARSMADTEAGTQDQKC
ncbi:hypothetical protein ACFLS0_06735 [Candidatus Bipolaricaulota bacterium]